MKLNFADVKSSVAVFLVALPLCLGIALASNAPLESGILAGIVGGIVVGLLGGSQVAISGPAAGLTVIVAGAILQLGSFSLFLTAVVLAGLIQVLLGLTKAGKIGDFFPSSVVKGMLSAIGLILVLKQIPHALGFDADFMGDQSFDERGGHNTFSAIIAAFQGMHYGATLIAILSLSILLVWDNVVTKKWKVMNMLPSALLAVMTAILVNKFLLPLLGWEISAAHMVQHPFDGTVRTVFSAMTMPSFSDLSSSLVWKAALTLALVASLETLLGMDAADKIDPAKRISRKNKELVAQGIGNTLCGLIGAIPITVVIVRTSINVTNGAKTRLSAVLHGVWLMIAVMVCPSWLNMIPLSALAAILILVGFRLTHPTLVKSEFRKGHDQFIPFMATILAIVFTDLLIGICAGLVIGIIFVLNRKTSPHMMFVESGGRYLLRFNKDVSFLDKSRLRAILQDIPDNSEVAIDGSRSVVIDYDIVETVEDFVVSAPNRGIKVEIMKSPLALSSYFKEC